jgi:putative heme transporter
MRPTLESMAAHMSVANATAARRRRVKVMQLVIGLALMVVTFAVFLPKIAGYGSVWAAVRSMSPWQVALLAIVAIWNLLTFGPNWMVALPGLRFWQSLEMNMAATAVANTVPAGSAVSFGISWAMLREWGFERRAVALALILNGIWNNLLNAGYPIVAVTLLALTGETNDVLMRAAFLGAVLFIVVVAVLVAIMHSEKQALRFGRFWDRVATVALRLLRRGPVQGSGLALVRFRVDSLELLRRRWLALSATIIIGTLSVFLVLLVALRVTGIGASDVTIIEAFTAWSLVRLFTALPLTPGGIGITELVLVGTLTQFGGDEANVVAAVLLYRALTYLPPVFIGALVAFTWRRHRAAERI